MTIYLLNTPILTDYGIWTFSGPITPDEARERLSNGFQSAIGHQASALFLSQLLAMKIPMQRIAVNLHPGDAALVLRIKSRLPEGRLLSQTEMAETPYELGWMERT